MSSAFYEAIRKKAGQKFYNVDENELINCMIEDLGNINSNEEKLIYIKNIIDYCKKQIEDYKINNQYYEFKNASKEIHIKRFKGIYNEPISELEINIGKYIKFVEKIEKTFEKNIKEPKQQKRKKEKVLKKFQWNDTEKSLLLIIELLYNSEFITQETFLNRYAVIRDTFKNESGNSFKNRQLSVTFNKEVKPLINGDEKIKKEDNIYRKLEKLKKELGKLISG